jgi:hypothetical protein
MKRLQQIMASLSPDEAEELSQEFRAKAVYRGYIELGKHIDVAARTGDNEFLEIFQQLIRRAQDLELAHSLTEFERISEAS